MKIPEFDSGARGAHARQDEGQVRGFFRVISGDEILSAGLHRVLMASGLLPDESDEEGFLLVHLADREDWAVLASELARQGPEPRRRVVAMIGSSAECSRALAAGVHAIWRVGSGTAELLECLRAARQGKIVLPLGCAREWGSHASRAATTCTDEEKVWLRQLAGGTTVSDLADRSHMDRTTLSRRLRRVYGKLGAANKSEALVAAAAVGLVGPHAAPLPAGPDGARL